MKDNNLPPHASVIVIGGGIMGCSTLYHLAKMGISDTILLERNKLPGARRGTRQRKCELSGTRKT